MWPSSLIHREAGQQGQVANDVISDKSRSFLGKNPTVYSIAWSREASLNKIPAIDVNKNTRGATSGQSGFFSGQQTFDGDNTLTKDRPRLKRTTIVFLHTAIIKSHSSYPLRTSRRTEKRNTVLKLACKGDINISEEI